MQALQENLGYQASALYSLAASGHIDFKTAVAGLEALIELADLNRNIIKKDGEKIQSNFESGKITVDEDSAIYELTKRVSYGASE
jgi:hypothetical protein